MALWCLATAGVQAQYTGSFQAWSATSADTWQTQSLAGAPFNVPANAIVEIAVRNGSAVFERYGGVRAVGSTLERRLLLMESESGGITALVLHVQANASSQIQHYSDVTGDVDFVLLGYWTSGTYVERMDTFTAGASASWTDKSLCTYGVGPAHLAEIVMTNDDQASTRSAGVRPKGSSLERRVTVNAAVAGGVAPATMLVKSDTHAGARIQVYAQDDTDVDFYHVGYWSTPPRAYTELMADIGSPTSSATWQDVDLTASGVSDGAMAEVLLLNQNTSSPHNMGVRPNGSSLSRLMNLHKAGVGGGNVGRMHVASDAGAVIEFYHADITQAHDFVVTGYWQACDSSVSYAVGDLGAVNAANASQAQRINGSGVVAAFEEDSDGNSAAWHLQCTTTASLGTLGGSYSEAHGINDSGTVVGWAHNGSGVRRAFRWTSGGGMVDLGTLSGRTGSEALSINSSSEIVGTAVNFGAPPRNRLAFLYLPSNAYGLSSGMNSLGTLGGSQSVAVDINDSGRVVGGAQNAGGNYRPFRWNSGTMTDLGTLGGDSGNPDHRASAVNSSGNIVGRSYTAGGAARAFYWDGSMSSLGVLTGGTESWAFGINDSNVVVGTSNVTGGAFHAFVWDGTNGLRDLNDLIAAGSGWTLIRATDINNSGSIVGWGTNPSSQTRAFLLTPTCSAGGGGSAAAAFVLAAGSGQTDEAGSFSEIALDVESRPLAAIEVHGDPAVRVEYEVIDAALADPPTGRPDPTAGLGFAEGTALSRTLRVVTPEGAGLSLVVSMTVDEDEVAALDATVNELELHVLKQSDGAGENEWAPAGKSVGESPPSGVLGDSGFVLYEDGTVDYWAVRDSGGVFAVGKPAADTITPPGPRACGIGMLAPLFSISGILLCVRRSRGDAGPDFAARWKVLRRRACGTDAVVG